MITAIVQYRLPPSIDQAACAEHFRRIAPGFRDVPGLIRKQFIYAEDGWAGGVYLWRSRADAEAPTDIEMPKLKTKSGAKKRFGRTASGKITMNVAHKRHRLISKPKQMKRKARGKVTLQPGDAKLVLTYMPYLRG